MKYRLSSLNLRLTLVIFTTVVLISIFWLATFNFVFFAQVDQNQKEYLVLLQDFLNKTKNQESSLSLPLDLQTDLETIQKNVQQRIDFVSLVNRWVWFVIITIFIILAPLTYFFALFLARRLTAPIKSVASASRKLAKGDLAVRVSPKQSTWDDYSLALANDFNNMAASLEEYEEERQTMIGDIAHELRTPVAIMQADLESLQDGVDPLTQEAVDSLYDETKLLSRLIIDLRTLSLAEAKQLSLELNQIDMTDLVQKTVARFQKEAEQKDIELSFEAQEQYYLHADAERLSQVLSNLLSNALRHTPNGGWVKVKLEQQEENLKLSVLDSGKGLSDDALKNVFDRFYRSDKGRVRSEGGSGLGLSIVKALVELHGGSVLVKNSPNGGAIFILYFYTPETLNSHS